MKLTQDSLSNLKPFMEPLVSDGKVTLMITTPVDKSGQVTLATPFVRLLAHVEGDGLKTLLPGGQVTIDVTTGTLSDVLAPDAGAPVVAPATSVPRSGSSTPVPRNEL